MTKSSVQLKGFKQFRKKLDDLQRKAKDAEGTHEIPFTELFPPSFLRQHTDFTSLEEMEVALEKSGFVIESQEDADKIPTQKWDEFTVKHTSFSSWEEMYTTAATEWFQRQLGFD